MKIYIRAFLFIIIFLLSLHVREIVGYTTVARRGATY